ncbi:hypothetical protein [Candidatus Odyssella acanthamoebae]|uniref:Uncharacterized protein n=1 Tax=Candidatus Odyssella acanthamoebae TaxID=91604 RepID=A0A077AT35_9PROT|nr:hypothetical protein [Candidatus Paracaedibacter acanthamoebae]AIK95526.1 hypothetical protein ID47_00260 [Candidatus Paracaedibacter acanthamoebae]
MKKSQIKISASHLSKAVLIAASLSCFGFSGALSAAEHTAIQKPTITIAEALHENLRQQALTTSDLEYKKIQITTFKKDDADEWIINERSKHNIGHQQNLIKASLKKRGERFSQINVAQAAARTLSKDFLPLIADLAYISFNHIFSFAQKGNISLDSLICAEETWLLKALIDYGMVSQAYVFLSSAKAADHDAIILNKTVVLTDSLTNEKKVVEDARDLAKETFAKEKVGLEEERQLSLKDKEEAKGEDLKQSHQRVIDKKEKELKQVVLKENKLELDTKAALEILDKKFKADIDKLKSAKEADLKKLQTGYDSLFSDFGFKWGGSWTRGARENIKEIFYFDELLSTQYTDFYSKARADMLKSIFSLVQYEDTSAVELRCLTLKALLGLDDSTYDSVLQSLIDQEKQNRKELVTKEATFAETLTIAINEVVSPTPSHPGGEEEKTPTAEQSKIAMEVVSGFDPLKKKSMN